MAAGPINLQSMIAAATQGVPPESATAQATLPGWLPRWASARSSGTWITGSVDNEEQGRTLVVCPDRQAPWREIWPQLQHLD